MQKCCCCMRESDDTLDTCPYCGYVRRRVPPETARPSDVRVVPESAQNPAADDMPVPPIQHGDPVAVYAGPAFFGIPVPKDACIESTGEYDPIDVYAGPPFFDAPIPQPTVEAEEAMQAEPDPSA